MTSVTVSGVGGIGAGIGINAELRAHKKCCMDKYENTYRYLGLGAGVGIDFTMTVSGDSEWFNTNCIEWKDHNGFGRVTTWGFGIGKTYGALWANTPQTYQYFVGPSYGLDASIVTTIGYWKVVSSNIIFQHPGVDGPNY